MPTPYKLEVDVVNEVKKYFHGDDVVTVLDKLENTELWAEKSGPPARVHIAMIWKSKGDMKIFLNSIICDAGDWRDLLLKTKLAHEGWQDGLLKFGIHSEKWKDM